MTSEDGVLYIEGLSLPLSNCGSTVDVLLCKGHGQRNRIYILVYILG
jgi:hypothetical protein